jgi:hypothetical protein
MKPKLPLLIWLALKLIDLFGKGLRRFLSVFSDFWKQGKPVGNPKADFDYSRDAPRGHPRSDPGTAGA